MAVVELELELKIVGVVAGRLKGIDMEKMVVDGESGQEVECIRCRRWRMVHWLMGVLQSLMEGCKPWIEVAWMVCGEPSSVQVGLAESWVDSGLGLERIGQASA